MLSYIKDHFLFPTDLFVVVQYLLDDQLYWGALTLAFVLLPSTIIQAFSVRWYAADGAGIGCGRCSVHMLQLQPVERYGLVPSYYY